MSKRLVTHDGGHPFSASDIDLMVDVDNENTLNAIQGQVPDGVTAQLLWGGAVSESGGTISIAAGSAYWDVPSLGKRVLRVAAGSVSVSGLDNVRLRLVTDANVSGYANNVTYKDGSIKRIYLEDYLELITTDDVEAGDKVLTVVPVSGETLLQPNRMSPTLPGEWKDWTLLPGMVFEDYFDTDWVGIHPLTVGWCIPKGQTINGVEMPNPAGRARIAAGDLVYPGVGSGGTYEEGDYVGQETVTLTAPQMPYHTHSASQVKDGATGSQLHIALNDDDANNKWIDMGATTGYAGGNQPHENRGPSIVTYALLRYL